jgi:hypothetical protein
MTYRACPDWPQLMEIAPDLQFKHLTLAEARLPAEALVNVPVEALSERTICCDLEHHVFHEAHTDASVGAALRGTHWFELGEWAHGPGAAA